MPATRSIVAVLCLSVIVTALGSATARPESTRATQATVAPTTVASNSIEPSQLDDGRWSPAAIDDALDGLQSMRDDYRERRAFLRRGMSPTGKAPVTTTLDPTDQLGALPAPGLEHPYLTVEFQQELDLLTDSTLTAGNEMKMLLNQQSWKTKRDLIDAAQSYVLVTAMVMRCDEGGEEFTKTMAAAAGRGVDTRFILDGLFSLYAFPCLEQMTEAGVKVSLSLRSLQPWSFDWEMHEKLLIVDGTQATIGGQNVGTWYQEATGTDTYYRDTDVLLSGPIVRQIGRRFVNLWTQIEPEDRSLDGLLSEWDLIDADDERGGLIGPTNYGTMLETERPAGLCRFVAQDPHLGSFHVWSVYQAHLDAARERVMLTAYALDPNGSETQLAFREALIALASKPGARVDIITNGSGVLESEVVPSPFRRSYARSILTQAWQGLGKTPVNLWVYDYFMHAKQYYFDGLAVGIGSFNYDASGNRCQESVIVCYDTDLVDDMETAFAVDIANSALVSQ